MTEKKKIAGIDRRSFMKTTATAGAGMVFSPMIMKQAKAQSNDELHVGLIGCGAEGQVLLDACLKIPGIRFKAVCDIWTAYNQKRVSRLLKKYKHDHKTYVDYKDLISEQKGKLDAVIIATPDFWHARHAIGCMEAGFHVYCEKEMATNLADARKMVETSKKTGRLLQIGHQRRSNPRYIWSYQKLIKEAQLLGRTTTVYGQWDRSAKPFRTMNARYAIDKATLAKYGFDSMEQFLNWRWYKGKGGGPIVDLGSHQIDIYNWFLECTPQSVIASGGTDYYDKKTHQWYDTVMCVFEYPTAKGLVRAYYQTLTTSAYGGYYEVFMGDQGALEISESASRGSVYRDLTNAPSWDKWVKMGLIKEPVIEKKKTTALLDVRETGAPPSYGIPIEMRKKYHQPHLENFFAAVRGKAKLNCPGEIGFETTVCVLRVNEAVEAQKRLTFDPESFKV